MALFVVEVQSCKISEKFFRDTDNRMNEDFDIVKKPYDCSIKRLDKHFYAVSIIPVYLKVYWLGLFFLIPSLIFFQTKVGFILFLVSIPFFSLRFLWSKYFFFLNILFGLRKAGYKGSVKLLGSGRALRRFYNGTNRRL
ncbi:MAG: hypothetical protein U9O78_03040 [Patescibacteria group bacterium]|nr:hypothetical protein [Patescibacteria group bacterium]